MRAALLRNAAVMPPGALPLVIGGVTLALEVGDLIDLPTERARLTKEIAANAVDIDGTARKLANAEFVAKAPEEVVEKSRARLAAAERATGKIGDDGGAVGDSGVGR